MPVRYPTKWTPPSGSGYVVSSDQSNITTQGSLNLTTQANVNLQIQSTVYKRKYVTSWNKSSKYKTKWQTQSGKGYVVYTGNKFLNTNNGFQLADNLGNYLATTETFNINEYATSWSKKDKNKTSWNTPSGTGYVVTVGTRFIITNNGDNLITNGNDYIVTTPTYNAKKQTTIWTLSGV